jgi:hypothetical protein
VGREALDRFGALDAIEAAIKGLPPAKRRRPTTGTNKLIAETGKSLVRRDQPTNFRNDRSLLALSVTCWRVGGSR